MTLESLVAENQAASQITPIYCTLSFAGIRHVYDSLWFLFPGCCGGEGRDDGKRVEEGLAEDMSVGELTKHVHVHVHVPVTCI